MKSMFSKALLALLTFTFLWFSCEKQEVEVSKAHELSLSTEEIRSVGTLHNEVLREAIDGFEASSKETAVSDLIKSLKKVGQSRGLTVSNEFINEASENANPKKLLEYLKSPESRNAFQKIMRILEEGDYRKIAKALDLTFQDAQNNLTGNERVAILLFVEVSKNSARLWLPKEQGGLGYGNILRQKLGRSSEIEMRGNSCFRTVLAHDGSAAATYFTGVGLGVLALPGTNVALVSAVGFTSAAASAWAYWSHDECNQR